MANGVCIHALGSFIEKVRDGAANLEVNLLKAHQAENLLVDHTTLSSLLAANTECDFTGYAAKTAQTGTLVFDIVNNRADVDMADQTWNPAGGATNNTILKMIVSYNEGAGVRTPLFHFDFQVATSGAALTAQFNAAGLARAQG